MTGISLNIRVPDRTKARIVSYNRFSLFKVGNDFFSEDEKIELFNQKWKNNLGALLTNSICEERFLTPKLVEHRLIETKKEKALKYVYQDKKYCEFLYEGLSCIAQLEEYNSHDFELQNLWGLRYSKLPPEVICIDLGDEANKESLEAAAKIIGKNPLELAKEAVLDRVDKIIRNLENRNQSLMLELESLRENRRQVNIEFYKTAINEFYQRLEDDYPEVAGEQSWQKWIYRNNWLFGVQYEKPIQQIKIGSDSIIDFLFPTIDGFIDILEIKLPKHEIIKEDSSHPGSYIWSSEANKAIGQVVNYLHKIEVYQSILYQELNHKYSSALDTRISLIKPRSFIVIGRSNNWDDAQRQGLRKLNHALHGIELLTYDDLARRGKSLIELYVREVQ